jgi:Domain of unknown function (DUF4173)
MEAAAPADVLQYPSRARPRIRAPARTLLIVTILGAAVTALGWRTATGGAAWPCIDLLLVGSVVLGIARGRPGAAGWMLSAATLWLAWMTCWYASDWALATARPASLATLGLLALVATRRIGPHAIDDAARAGVDALAAIPRGMLDAARLPADSLGSEARGQAGGLLLGALVGLPFAAFFALLLSADTAFRGALGTLAKSAGTSADFGACALAATTALLVAHAVLRRIRRPRETASLVTAPEVAANPYRTAGTHPPAKALHRRLRIRPLAWGAVLSQLVAIFAVYAVANVRTLFIGHAQVQARGTVTYAQYLHEGFLQVSLATLLAVTCVIVGHALLRPPTGVGPIQGGKPLAVLEIALLALVAVALASCAHRLAIYEEAYGYTYFRLGVRLVQLGIAGLLAMTAARCVARARRGFAAALTWSGVALALLTGSIDADGWIAGRNAARARAGAKLDVSYLSTLSEDASGSLAEIAAVDGGAAARLESVWAAAREWHRWGDWRSWRGLRND